MTLMQIFKPNSTGDLEKKFLIRCYQNCCLFPKISYIRRHTRSTKLLFELSKLWYVSLNCVNKKCKAPQGKIRFPILKILVSQHDIVQDESEPSNSDGIEEDRVAKYSRINKIIEMNPISGKKTEEQLQELWGSLKAMHVKSLFLVWITFCMFQ